MAPRVHAGIEGYSNKPDVSIDYGLQVFPVVMPELHRAC
jgi:hypothetical protein